MAPASLTDRRVTALSTVLAIATTVALAGVLPTRGHFLADEARLYDGAATVATTGRLAPFGTVISGTDPPLVLPGGAAFDLLAPPFLFFETSPWWGSLFVLLLSGVGVLIFDRALRRLEVAPPLRAFAVALLSFSIWHARFADRLWNYHLFQLATPLLLWLAAVLKRTPRSLAAALAIGVLSGIALQLNPTGLLAVAIALAIALDSPERQPTRLLVLAAAGLVVAYLPYLVADAPRNFPVMRQLIADRGMRPALDREAWRSLLVFPAFASQSDPVAPERVHGILAPALSFWAAVPLTLAGFWLRSPLRTACRLALVLVPASFLLSGRIFTPQYAVALLPLYFVPAAASLAFCWERGRAGACLALAYLMAFAALGAVLVRREYLRPLPVRPTIAAQLAVTDALLALHRPVHWVDRSMFDEPIIYQVLARRVRGQELMTTGPGPDAWLAQPPLARSLVVEERPAP